jgi:TRAP-type C4-dicarboxylate transport system permease small subunit
MCPLSMRVQECGHMYMKFFVNKLQFFLEKNLLDTLSPCGLLYLLLLFVEREQNLQVKVAS